MMHPPDCCRIEAAALKSFEEFASAIQDFNNKVEFLRLQPTTKNSKQRCWYHEKCNITGAHFDSGLMIRPSCAYHPLSWEGNYF